MRITTDINEPSVANPRSMARGVRHIGVALLLTELVMLFFTLSTASRYGTTLSISLSSSPLI
jgi:hypothetical protein